MKHTTINIMLHGGHYEAWGHYYKFRFRTLEHQKDIKSILNNKSKLM